MNSPPLTLNAWLRHDLVARMLRDLPGLNDVLEIGPGEGAFGTRLARQYAYVGVEPDPRSASIARRRLARLGSGILVQGDLSALPPEAYFDLLCAFEVIEHIEDDAAALAEWRDRLRPGGWVLLSTPAHPDRFAAGDRLAGHYRRYARRELASLLRTIGFEEVVVWSYGFPLGYPLEWVRNAIARFREPRLGSMAERTAASGRYLQPPESLDWMTEALSWPFRLAQRPFVDTDLGTGLVARGRRSGAGEVLRPPGAGARPQAETAGDDGDHVGPDEKQPLAHRRGDDVASGDLEPDRQQKDGLAHSDSGGERDRQEADEPGEREG
jgi:SAM-dependent methyltransferase